MSEFHVDFFVWNHFEFISPDELLADFEKYFAIITAPEHRHCCFARGGYGIYTGDEMWNEDAWDELGMAETWLPAVDALLNGAEAAHVWAWEESGMTLTRKGDLVEMEDIHHPGAVICAKITFPLITFARAMAEAALGYGEFCDKVRERLDELDPDPDILPAGFTTETRPLMIKYGFSAAWTRNARGILAKINEPGFEPEPARPFIAPKWTPPARAREAERLRAERSSLSRALTRNDLEAVREELRALGGIMPDDFPMRESLLEELGWSIRRAARERQPEPYSHWLADEIRDVLNENRDLYELVLELGIDIKWDGFYSALHTAIECGDKPQMELLLDLGADPNGRDGKGRTPLDLARANLDTELIAYLKSRGATV